MIVDNINNVSLYYGLGSNMKKALEFLIKTDFSTEKAGRHTLSDDILYIVADYVPKPSNEVRLEAHRKFIDVQYLCSGTEIIGYRPLTELAEDGQYDEVKDVAFFSGESVKVVMNEGDFMILFPQDGHQPGVCLNNADEPVRKIVVKIPV